MKQETEQAKIVQERANRPLAYWGAFWSGNALLAHPVHTEDGKNTLVSIGYRDEHGMIYLYQMPLFGGGK